MTTFTSFKGAVKKHIPNERVHIEKKKKKDKAISKKVNKEAKPCQQTSTKRVLPTTFWYTKILHQRKRFRSKQQQNQQKSGTDQNNKKRIRKYIWKM